MVGCSAVGCSNRSEQGFIMKYFPKDKARRKVWEIKMRRDNWTPTDRSVLCQVHFAPEMWEKIREDGKLKLKRSAIPTLFSFSKQSKPRKPPTKRFKKEHIEETEDPNNSMPSSSEISNTLNLSTSSNSLCESTSSSMYISSPQTVKMQPLDTELQKYRELSEKLWKRNNKLIQKLKTTKRKVKSLQKTAKSLRCNNDQLSMMKQIFNDDQIYAINNTHKFRKWSDATIKKALKLKFACGNNGYNELLKQKIPLPSLRTLTRRLQNLKFTSGILDEVFEFLKLKINILTEHERYCSLVVDEMAITPGLVYDNSSRQYIGNVTLPEHSGVANNALVVMLAGVTSRWKQTVAYYFTDKTTNGAEYENIIFKLIEKAEELGLLVVSLTSDMGSSNLALWKKWNICAGRYQITKNYIVHPLDSTRKIYILADVPHLFKNIKNMFITNSTITISDELKLNHNLPTNLICASHISDLINHQKDFQFPLAHKLCEADLLPDNFRKMKVQTSTNVINHDVASALRFIAVELKKPEYLTTSWFIDLVDKWFYLMSSRHPTSALSKMNEHVYKETIEFLEKVIDIFSQLHVGARKTWKPSQTGLIISTTSILNLQDYFLNNKNFSFLLTSRFTQDCLENLFSAIRIKQSIPTPEQFKNNLKLITVSQFLKDVSKSNYHQDDREFLSEFLNTIRNTSNKFKLPTAILKDIPMNEVELNNSEKNSLYNIIGYLVTSIKKSSKTCNNCIASVGSLSYNATIGNVATLVKLRCYKKNTLFYANIETFNNFLRLEQIFRNYFEHLKRESIDLRTTLVRVAEEKTMNWNLPLCHNLRKKLINRYFLFRLRISSKKMAKEKVYSSKTMRP